MAHKRNDRWKGENRHVLLAGCPAGIKTYHLRQRPSLFLSVWHTAVQSCVYLGANLSAKRKRNHCGLAAATVTYGIFVPERNGYS